MKAFRFPFDRVRQWRAQQLEIEEARLQKLFQERNAIRAARTVLAEERLSEENAVRASGSATAQELSALDAFVRYVLAEYQRLNRLEADCEARITAQRQQVADARRRVELLDRLKEKRRAEWQLEFDREQENLSGELFLAKWKPAQAAVQPPSIDSTWPCANPASSEHR